MDDIEFKQLRAILALFEQAKTLGSLVQVPQEQAEYLRNLTSRLQDLASHGDIKVEKLAATVLLPYVHQAWLLAQQYNAVVANPPYMGYQYLNKSLKELASFHYKSSKGDLFAIFIDRLSDLIKESGVMSFMTPFTWLFIGSYENFRREKLNKFTFLSLVKPEYHSFFDSAFVPICSFTILNKKIYSYRTTCFDMNSFYGSDVQAPKLIEGINQRSLPYVYERNFDDFKFISSCPFVFSLNPELLKQFRDKKLIGRDAKKGVTTGDNERFLRQWYEVDFVKTSITGGDKWFPMTKGGAFRKWYGNFEAIIKWENNGYEIRNFKDQNGKLRSRPQNLEYNFKEGITWNDVTVSDFTARYVPKGFVFNAVGPMVFGGMCIIELVC